MINAVKHPYKCLQTKEGLGAISKFLIFLNGIKGQLAHIFEWILEAGLHVPFEHLDSDLIGIVGRNFWNKLKSFKGQNASDLEGNLLTLWNLIRLFIASAVALILAGFVFLVECEGRKSFVFLIIGYVQSQ
jgi:hypothetical protein